MLVLELASTTSINMWGRILHVDSGADQNGDVESVVLFYSINGGLDRPELAGTIDVNGDYAVSDGPNPLVAMPA